MCKVDGIKLSFAANINGYLRSIGKGIDISIENGTMKLYIYYDFKEEPLQMTANVIENDKIEVIILPYRIDVIVNGKVEDEEWPAGRCYYHIDDRLDTDMEITVQKIEYEEKEEPSFIKTFTNAEGWRPEENVFVGDCMPYSTDDEYHIIYLKDRRHHKSKWGLGAHQWGHISTKDFCEWSVHPAVVKITDETEGAICTGSWIKKDNIQYVFYTVRMYDGSPAPIRRSVSSDGYHYEKDKSFSFTLSKKYDTISARDPKVVFGEDGLYHMFLTTSFEGGNGCLAHLVSKDLDNWQEENEPIYISPDKEQPECADYIKYGDYYYLIFSLKGVGQYLYSHNPFTDWKIPNTPVIPCETVPKCALWNGKLVFAGFKKIDCYAGTLTFKYASKDKNDELIFK